MDINYWLKKFVEQDLSIADARYIIKNICHLDYARQYLGRENFNPQQISALNEVLTRLKEGEPLAYILGEAYFFDFKVKVNADVLIPRPDTEILVNAVLETGQNFKNIVDLGTGSGIIAIALAMKFPEALIIAVDKSVSALAIAKENVKNQKLNNIIFHHGDWLTSLKNHTFDCIVANPPYISPTDNYHLDKLKFEPISALVAENEGFSDLFKIVISAKEVLTSDGFLFLEHGYQQGEKLRDYFRENNYKNIITIKDLAGNERVTLGQK